jgi:hypothetical protein
MRKASFPLILAIFLAAAGHLHAAKEGGEKPRIYLEKRVIAEKTGEQIKFFELYRMKRDDTLWEIFIDKLGGRKEEFDIFLDAFKKANPEIQNPSRIKRGAGVNLPMNVGTLGKKTVVDNMLQEGQVVEHTVVEGDVLWRIAQSEFNRTRDLLKFVEEVQRLNPFLKDPDWIFPGQKLYIPKLAYFAEGEKTLRQAFATGKGDERTGGADDLDLSAGKPLLDRPEEEAVGHDGAEKAYPEKVFEREGAEGSIADSGAATSVGTEKTAPSDFQMGPPHYRGLLGDILSALGEGLVYSGEMYIPFEGGGELVLNMENYPIARFSKGKSLILDLFGSLPVEVEKVLRDKWKGYAILRRDREMDFELFVESVLKNGGYYAVKKGNETQLVIGEKVSLSINSDLIVLKEGDSILKGEVYAIKRLKTPSQSDELTNIYAYCLKTGVVVIPYYVDRSIGDGYVVSYFAESSDGNMAREKIPEKLPDGAKYILDAAGIKADRSRKILIKGQEGAFTLTIKPDLTFWVGGQPYVLDPERFTEPIRNLLEKEGYRILRVKGNSSYSSIIPRLLEIAGKEFSYYKNEVIAGGKGREYTLSASGIMLGKEATAKGEDILYVSGEVDMGMRELLLRYFGVRVVTY